MIPLHPVSEHTAYNTRERDLIRSHNATLARVIARTGLTPAWQPLCKGPLYGALVIGGREVAYGGSATEAMERFLAA